MHILGRPRTFVRFAGVRDPERVLHVTKLQPAGTATSVHGASLPILTSRGRALDVATRCGASPVHACHPRESRRGFALGAPEDARVVLPAQRPTLYREMWTAPSVAVLPAKRAPRLYPHRLRCCISVQLGYLGSRGLPRASATLSTQGRGQSIPRARKRGRLPYRSGLCRARLDSVETKRGLGTRN